MSTYELVFAFIGMVISPPQGRVIKSCKIPTACGIVLASLVETRDFGKGYREYGIRFTLPGRRDRRHYTVDVGAGKFELTHFECHDFTGRGRKQVFATTGANGFVTKVLDFDGARVRSLYATDGGRVIVCPVRAASGRWKLRERWPVRQWTDVDDLGTGKAVGVNEVERYVHWNGRRFVADRPGPSRIIRQQLKAASVARPRLKSGRA